MTGKKLISCVCGLLVCSGLLLTAVTIASAEEIDVHAKHRAMAAKPGYTREERQVTVPNVQLVNQHGESVGFQGLVATDRPVVLNFIFTTCPSICPVLSGNMSAAQRQFEADHDDVLMVSISVDPEYDTPRVLKDYAELHRAGPQWAFLTGSSADIVTVQKAFDAYRGNKMNHAAITYIRRANGDSDWLRLDGFPRPSELAHEFRLATTL